jgi:hypothetical protein
MSESHDGAVTISRRGQQWWVLVGGEVNRRVGGFESPEDAREWLNSRQVARRFESSAGV